MGKLDDLTRKAGSNADESMGAGVPRRPLVEGMAVSVGGARFKDVTKPKDVIVVPTDKLAPDPNQPRKAFNEDDLQNLADSIAARGLLQPIRVRWDDERQKYAIVAGERRWRAARMAGKPTVTCVVAEEGMDQTETLHDQLVENCVRSDLTPIEQANAFKTLMDAKEWTSVRLAEELHIRDSTISKVLALLDLPREVQAKVADGTIKPATAYELSQLEKSEDQVALAEKVVKEKLTRDDVAAAVKGRGPGKPKFEIKLDSGRKVTVTGIADEEPETVISALKAALRQLQQKARSEAA